MLDQETAAVGGAQTLPDEFMEWQLASRRDTYAAVAAGRRPPRFGAHLPVVVTLNSEGSFPVHTAAKGTGFLPAPDHLDEHIGAIDDCLVACEGRPWEETLEDRITVIRGFYENPDHIDRRCLGLLEIFCGQTYRNVQADSRVALHYTGDGPDYPSFQVNAIAEIVTPEDRRFQFIYLARRLFEHDHFHIHQPDYPLGYVAWVRETFDKSPFHGRAGRRMPTKEPAPSPVRLRELFLPLDNSDYAAHCMAIGLQLAESFGSRITGSHVYAARLHDDRFRQMEAGLPARYQEPNELQRQRRIHDSLITTGLQLISDSYLDVLGGACREERIEFVGKRPEGKNYAALVADINETGYDLVVMGTQGLGSVERPANSNSRAASLGSVAERVARRSRRDVLFVRNDSPLAGHIVVAVDGSPQSFAGVRLACSIAGAVGASVEAVAAYDPDFHTVAFQGLEGVLSEDAGRVFRFREQEKLHDEIINKGIAQIYAQHLDTARRIALEDGREIGTTLLQGKTYPAVLDHVAATEPSLLVVGRLGVHADAGLDLGATAENLLRLASCHVLLVASTFNPVQEDELLEALRTGVPWTPEALEHLDNIPPFARSFARKAIDDFASERGYPEVTVDVMAAAREEKGM